MKELTTKEYFERLADLIGKEIENDQISVSPKCILDACAQLLCLNDRIEEAADKMPQIDPVIEITDELINLNILTTFLSIAISKIVFLVAENNLGEHDD